MNKKQSFKSMWVPISKRFPPNTNEEILIHEKIQFGRGIIDYYETRKAGVVLQHIQEDINHRNIAPAVKYWMKIYSPEKD